MISADPTSFEQTATTAAQCQHRYFYAMTTELNLCQHLHPTVSAQLHSQLPHTKTDQCALHRRRSKVLKSIGQHVCKTRESNARSHTVLVIIRIMLVTSQITLLLQILSCCFCQPAVCPVLNPMPLPMSAPSCTAPAAGTLCLAPFLPTKKC